MNKKNEKILIVYCVYPVKFPISVLVKKLLKDKLIVCANILPNVRSHYVWNNKTTVSNEVIVLFKTHSKNEKKLGLRLLAEHPYQVPLVAVIKPKSVNQSYLSFLTSEL